MTSLLLEKLAQVAKNISPIDTETFYAHAFSLYQIGDVTRAAEVFFILCARHPLEAHFWFGLGASYQESGQYQQALYAWAMSAILKPEDPYPHFHAAECSHSIGQLTDALYALEAAKMRLDSMEHPLVLPINILENRWNDL